MGKLRLSEYDFYTSSYTSILLAIDGYNDECEFHTNLANKTAYFSAVMHTNKKGQKDLRTAIFGKQTPTKQLKSSSVLEMMKLQK